MYEGSKMNLYINIGVSGLFTIVASALSVFGFLNFFTKRIIVYDNRGKNTEYKDRDPNWRNFDKMINRIKYERTEEIREIPLYLYFKLKITGKIEIDIGTREEKVNLSYLDYYKNEDMGAKR